MRPSATSNGSLQVEEPEQPNFSFTLVRYARYWYLFALSLLLAFGGAYLYLLYATPQYNITSTLLLKDKKSEAEPVRNERFIDPSNLSTAKNIDNEIIVFKSASLMERALTELSLNTSFYIKKQFRNQEVYQNSLPFQVIIKSIDSSAYSRPITLQVKDNNQFSLTEKGGESAVYQFDQLITKPYAAFTVVSSPGKPTSSQPIIIRFHDVRQLAAAYARKLVVSTVNKQASILSLSLMDPVPEKGKDIINKLIEVYNKETVEDKNALATNTIAFIDERLKGMNTEISTVEKGVETFKRRNNVADVGSQINQSLQETSDYNRQISDYGIQISVLESLKKHITDPANQEQLIPGTINVQDPTLSGLIAKFNELQLDRERMLRTAQASNPFVETMTAQLTNLRANILENINSVSTSLSTTQRNLQAKMGQFSSRIQQVPTIERGLQQISRQQELKQALYLYLLQKREEAALTLDATVSISRIIDPATAGEDPVSPIKSAVFLVALILGLGLPFAFVYVRGVMDDKIHLIKDVEWATNVPILGEIAHSKTKESVVITKEANSPIAEMFRLVRTNLQFATADKANNVILVTSSMSGEGKTFFCLNLGASLVLAGKKVVVVSLDLRKANSVLEAGMAPGKGITEYLLSDSMLTDDIVQPSQAVPGLYVIGAGALPPNPSEVMMSPKMPQLLDVLKESFDYIILDSAPVGQVADAFTLKAYIDATIYVVRYNYTHKAQLDIINKIYAENRLNQMMLVVNDAKKSNMDSYGYGYGYGYPEAKHKRGNLV